MVSNIKGATLARAAANRSTLISSFFILTFGLIVRPSVVARGDRSSHLQSNGLSVIRGPLLEAGSAAVIVVQFGVARLRRR